MKRCFTLAKNGLGSTYPNPLVGALLVVDNAIIAEGWHQKAGAPHAEVNAIAQIKDPTLLEKATLYVNLEPCCHFGKTPPCTQLIIDKKIPRVVISNLDPNPLVAGKGVAILKHKGIDVVTGVLASEGLYLNRRFFTFHTKNRPFIFLKWAQTKQGFIAPKIMPAKQAPVWISNASTQVWTHQLRAENQAILIGTNTALKDNPSLTTRKWHGANPTRILIDKDLKVPDTASIFSDEAFTIICNKLKSAKNNHVEYIQIDFSKPLPPQITSILYNKGIQSLIVEGGANTIQQFINTNYWDEAYKIIGQSTFIEGIHAPALAVDIPINTTFKIDTDFIEHYFNPTA